MSKRLSAVESLARDICWAGFTKEGQRGKTKSSYWSSISGYARGGYLEEAAIIVRAVNQLGPDRIVLASRQAVRLRP